MATKWDTALEGARGLPCPALIGSMRVSPPRGLPDRIRRSLPTLGGSRADYLLGITDDPIAILDPRKILADPKVIVQEDVEG